MSEKIILHLNLTSKWFDLIQEGIKTEEYREIKPYWQKRFRKPGHVRIGNTWFPFRMVRICFSNGYSRTRRQMFVDLRGMRFDSPGVQEWGAIPGETYFVLELQKVES